MKDKSGRNINYLRISVTDKCNFRCRYCMPDPVPDVEHEEILRYEEILRICEAAVRLGIRKFKITGGEPLVRKGCVDFMQRLKETDGVETVTLTTNGMFVKEHIEEFKHMGLDGINISLDTLDLPDLRPRSTRFFSVKRKARSYAWHIWHKRCLLMCVL